MLAFPFKQQFHRGVHGLEKHTGVGQGREIYPDQA